MNIIFDLDGTIIDSCEGIQTSFNIAFESIYQKKNTKSIKEFVGPPVQEILTNISGEQNVEKIEKFIEVFKTHYDTEAYKLCLLYKDIEIVLQRLVFTSNLLFLCTNKRIIPTQKILKYFSIDRYFQKVFCLDSEKEIISNKTDLVKHIISTQLLEVTKTILIGDTKHDEEAALGNNLKFVYASYGFGRYEDVNTKLFINQPMDIFKYLT